MPEPSNEATTAEMPPSAHSAGRDTQWRNRVIAVGVAAGLTLAGLGIASAQTDSTPTTDPAATTEDKREKAERPGGPAKTRVFAGGPGRGHMGGMAMGMGTGIRGEMVVPGPGGEGWQTIAHQIGEVTEVSASSVTIKSADGFSRTYAVNDDTLVNAGNDGIADVKTGDEVRVTAIVNDDKATAVDLHDHTNIAASRQKWAPAPAPRERAAADEGTSS